MASNKSKPTIILGSRSPTRFSILKQMGFEIKVRPADIDEYSIGDRSGDPEKLVQLIGHAKAEALLPKLAKEVNDASTLLLTGDQVVLHKGNVLEKPLNFDEVRKNIKSYCNDNCQTVGSIVLTHVKSGKRVAGTETSTIYFKTIPDSVIDELCKVEDVLWSAGGLIAEHPLVEPFVEKIDGTLEGIMGLCPNLVIQLMEEIKLAVESDS
eukprot:CAMPEP_0171458934 /NCGR_PEP_ID=MMETSP0945-20130129/4415_1 /TAXON_ID=109269 /ORGANISM="Vaucheria litorea, Strain CCMP2940" /LENGTH=209 /DNA_ID=CAMNT_0011984843 /DNA_START=90 /DNA_END=719 /DNA_ORIENTATION=+